MADFARILLSLAGIAVGAVGYRYAYQLSRFGEQLDAIGSTTPMEEVEPANWKVLMTQLCFIGLGAFSALMALFGVFSA